MRAILTRISTSDEGTKGELVIDGEFRIFTLELPWRDNKVRRSCIPAGTYSCTITDSPKFGRVYCVNDVPGRSAILIHSGNFAGDVKQNYRSDVAGCIILGTQFGNIDGQLAVLNSRLAKKEFMEFTDERPFQLIIEDEVTSEDI